MSDAPRYACLLMDPPWPERGGCGRGADNHYPVVEVREMPRLILTSPAWRPAADAHVWMWATNTHLPEALWLLGTLGATYKTCATWVKRRWGLGQYLRQRTEHLLLGVIGNGLALRASHTERRDVSNLIEETFRLEGRGTHSRKPPEAYDLIEAISPGPRVELFSRTERPGWDRWGRDAPEGDGLLHGNPSNPLFTETHA